MEIKKADIVKIQTERLEEIKPLVDLPKEIPENIREMLLTTFQQGYKQGVAETIQDVLLVGIKGN